MTWISWRQLRTSSLVVGAALAVVVVVLAVTGVHLNHLDSAYRNCSALTCDSAYRRLTSAFPHINLIELLVVAAPAVLGIFWGGPLISREIESGTFRLAWTQGVSRTRWVVTKLAVGALATTLAVGVLTFAMTWWAIPLDRAGATRIDPTNFAERGIVPVAYALFAFALGAAGSAVIRRTVPAMAATLAGFIGVRILMQLFVRQRLIAPLHRVFSLSDQLGVGIERSGSGAISLDVSGKPQLHDAWVTGAKLVDGSGHSPSSTFLTNACRAVISQTPQGPPSGARTGPKVAPPEAVQAFQACLHNVGLRYHEVVAYQPESRFWQLQWLESAIFLGLAAALVGLSIYWVRRRLA